MKKIIAQIGLGRWGQNILRNLVELKDYCFLKYACDLDKSVIKKAKSLYPQVIYINDFEIILNDPDVSAVVVSTPAFTHFDLVKKSLLSGKHVFVEKPLTLSSSQAKELVKIASQKKLKLMVGHLLVYHPATREAKRLIQKGVIGKVLFFYFRRTNLGVFRELENVFWDTSVHDVATLLFLLDGQIPETVVSSGVASFRKNIEEVAQTTLSFKNGLKAFFFSSWLDPFKIRQTVIVGQKGMLVIDEHDKESKLKLYKKFILPNKRNNSFQYLDNGVELISIPEQEPLKVECLHFLEALNGAKVITDGLSGFKVLKILEAVNQSLKNNGKIVKIKN